MAERPNPSDSRPAAAAPGNTPPHDLSTVNMTGMPLPSISGYEVVREIKRGGMGIVYRAHRSGQDTPVAIKMMLRGACADRSELERFHREAKAVPRLDHPNIVRVFDFGEQDGIPYFIMEFVEEGSLKEHLSGRPLPCPAAARIVEILARAMQHAHERGVVHRDLKPANVLMSGQQESGVRNQGSAVTEAFPLTSGNWVPKVADFGLAERLYLGENSESQGASTQSGAILGTPPYMAPEQARGQVRDI